MVRSAKTSLERPPKKPRREGMQKDINSLKEKACNEHAEIDGQDVPSSSNRPLWGELGSERPQWSNSRPRSSTRPSIQQSALPPITPPSWPEGPSSSRRLSLPDSCPPVAQNPLHGRSMLLQERTIPSNWLPAMPVARPAPFPSNLGSTTADENDDLPSIADDEFVRSLGPVINESVINESVSRSSLNSRETSRDVTEGLVHARLAQFEAIEQLDHLQRQSHMIDNLDNLERQTYRLLNDTAFQDPIERHISDRTPQNDDASVPARQSWPPQPERSSYENLRPFPAMPPPPVPPPRPRQSRRDPTQRVADLMNEILASDLPQHLQDNTFFMDSMAALHEVLAGSRGGSRLPAHLMFSDRDFNENDYDALLALDDNIPSRQGASQEEMDKIPTVVVDAQRDGCKENRCPICLEDFETGAILRVMHCKHAFHLACLDTWLSRKGQCPICQRSCKCDQSS